MAIEDFHNQIKGNIICKADFSCSNKSTFGDNYAIITDFPLYTFMIQEEY